MSRVETRSGTLAVNPYSLINKNTDGAYDRIVNYSNPYGADETASTYAEIHLVRGSGAITYVYYLFDTSSIPADATIDSVECKAKVFISNGTSNNIATRQVQMFSGTTAMGSAQNATTTVGVRTFSGVTWTRSEVNDVRIRFYAVRGTKNTSSDYLFRFYGATLTITYEYQENVYTITASSSVSGVTVSPASQDCNEGDNATISISGSLSGARATDNNVDVTSLISGTSPNLTYTISSVAGDHTFSIIPGPSGPTVFYKQNGTWVQADAVFYKQNGSWVQVEGMSVKDNGTWKS